MKSKQKQRRKGKRRGGGGGSKTLNKLQKCPLTYQQLDVPGIEMVKTRNMFLHILQNANQTTHTGTKTTKSGDKKIVRLGF